MRGDMFDAKWNEWVGISFAHYSCMIRHDFQQIPYSLLIYVAEDMGPDAMHRTHGVHQPVFSFRYTVFQLDGWLSVKWSLFPSM